MMSFEFKPKYDKDDAPENINKLSEFLEEARKDFRKQKALAKFLNKDYGIRIIEREDGSYDVLEKLSDMSENVVDWTNRHNEIARMITVSRDMLLN